MGDGKTKEERKRIKNALFSGAVSAGLSKTIIAPIERIQIYTQVNNEEVSYRELSRIIKNFILHESNDSLWRGNVAAISRISPFSGVQFLTYEYMKSVLIIRVPNSDQIIFTPFRKMLAGCIAGTMATAVTYPFDFIRARYAVIQPSSFNYFMKAIHEREGSFSFYRGLSAGVIGNIPFSSACFFTFETSKEIYLYFHPGVKEVPKQMNFIFGAVGGLVGTVASYPFDLLRKRMQVVETMSVNLDAGLTRSLIKISQQSIYELYRCITLNCIKNSVSLGISFFFYETIQNYFK